MKSKHLQSKLIILSFLIFCLTCFNTFAQTKKISLQGFLKDANGKAVSDGDQSLTFKIYTVASGGTAIWSEDQTLKVFGGVYSAQLGSITNITTLAWDVPYFVGVTVQGTELTPRTELTYAPYSFGTNKAQEAVKAQEVVCSGAVGDIKYSILNPTQFAAVNGSCWIPMDGRTITGSKLATILGVSTVSDAGGMFLRGQEFATSNNNDPDRTSASAIATFQDQGYLNHGHTASSTSVGNHSHVIALRLSNGTSPDIKNLGGYYPSGNGSRDTSSPMIAASDRGSEGTVHDFDVGNGGSHNHTITVSNNGGTETRTKNLNLWTYIRIN